jgi:lysophospholipase L1-like esterase
LWRASRRAAVGLAAVLAASALVVLAPGGPTSLGTTTASAAVPVPGATNGSYAIVDAAGGVMTFGGAAYDGDTLEVPLAKPVVDGVADPLGGYWLVASDGGVFSFGAAQFWGSTGGLPLNKPIVGMAPTADGNGYWLVASDGGIFAFGDAQFYGSTGSIALNKPIVGMATTADGNGYWLVASDGGIFAFGDAQFYGSTGGIHLNQPVVGMAATGDGNGYWLVASDGGIFSYGNAQFYGSTGGIHLNEPIVAMTPTQDGNGYWLVAQDAGVFDYGDAGFSGSAQSPLHPPLFPKPLSNPIPAVVSIINEAPGPQATHQGQQRVAFSGDSLSLYEGNYIQGTNPPYAVDDAAAAGCGYTDGAPTIPWSDPTSTFYSPGACALWASQLQWVVSRFHPDVTVIQTGYWETQDRMFNGAYTTLANPAYAAFIQNNLAQAVQIAHSGGGSVILSTSPYFADGTPTTLVSDYNQIVNSVASEFAYVSIDDLYTVLDPGGAYSSVVNGILARGSDGVHITAAGVDNLIEPALNQIIANVAGAVYVGNG